MTTEERVKEALEMFRKAGLTPEFNSYLQKLKKEDSLALSMVEVYTSTLLHQFAIAIKKGSKLTHRVGGRPWLAWRLFLSIGAAYRAMGEIEIGDTYTIRALEMAEQMGDREAVSRTRIQIYTIRFFKAEYEWAYKGLLDYKKDHEAWEPRVADYTIGACALVKGNLKEAINTLGSILKAEERNLFWFVALEMKALALRLSGKLPEAMEGFVESVGGQVSYDSAYSAFPMAKAMELSRLAGLEPPPRNLVRKALMLGRKGGWGEQAAAQEIEALLEQDDAEAAGRLFEASENYLRAYQNIEALFSGLTAAYLAWKTDSPVFTKALKLIAPLIPLHPGFKKDPLLGDLMSEMEPFLTKALKPSQDNEGIKAYLIGKFRVLVDGKEIRVTGWGRSKAIKALIYLLLSPKHRIPVDHLFYLLWPRRAYNEKTRSYLHSAITTIRRNLGRRELLTHTRDFYQLECVWTDLSELESMVRRIDISQDPDEKRELLTRAREIAGEELLSEFPYDRHIDEYRQYYERLRKRVFQG